MAIDPVSSAASAATASGTKLAENFDTFLTILTTQLQHQDPLEPLDSNEFTQQLVMFTQAEQSIAVNKNLESLISLSEGNQATAAIDYLGKTIIVEGENAVLQGGAAFWSFELPINAAQNTVTIKNADGNVVATGNAEIEKGTHVFSWDGTNDQGVPQPNGIYEISFSAKDPNGLVVPVETTVAGIVDGVEIGDDGVVLSMGGVQVPVEDVITILTTQQVQTAPPPETAEDSGETEETEEEAA